MTNESYNSTQILNIKEFSANLQEFMLRTVVIFAPFMVCLFWFIIFAIGYRKACRPKRVLTWFLLTCTVLYLCHGLFFSGVRSRAAECIWALCSLSVYPIYYLYIRTLTENISGNFKQYLVLLPGFIVFLILVFMPGRTADTLRATLSTVLVIFVCWSGIVKLQNFDKLVTSCYSDLEGRRTSDVKAVLIVLVITSCISAGANIIGKSFFADNDVLLLAVAMVFATMLFSLSYIGYTKEFTYLEFSEETEDDAYQETPPEPDEVLGRKIDALMAEEKIYLEKGLKITDMASRIGSCRTYVSQYINRVKGEPFSDYINRLRIEEAKEWIRKNSEAKNAAVAEATGFTSEQSFYKNFKKFTGMTPAEWKKKN